MLASAPCVLVAVIAQYAQILIKTIKICVDPPRFLDILTSIGSALSLEAKHAAIKYDTVELEF